MYCLPDPSRPPIAELERQQQPLQHAALLRPARCRCGCARRGSPRRPRAVVAASHARTPARRSRRPGGASSVSDFVAAVAVVPDRRRRHEHARLAVEPGERAREQPRARACGSRARAACAAGVHFLSPMPAPARCTTASRPSSPAASIVPARDPTGRRRRPRVAPHQPQHAMAAAAQRRDQRRADETVRPGDGRRPRAHANGAERRRGADSVGLSRPSAPSSTG